MKCDIDIGNVVRQCRVVKRHEHVPTDCGAHDEGIDRVDSINDEIHGGCYTRVKVLGMDWRIHPVFCQLIPAGIVFFCFFVGEVPSRRQRVCCSAFAS